MKAKIIKIESYFAERYNFNLKKFYTVQHYTEETSPKRKCYLLYDDNGKALTFYDHQLEIQPGPTSNDNSSKMQ